MNKAAIWVGAALICQSAAAAAAETDSPPSVSVSVADLNLRSPEGLAMLDARILAAARRVCPDAGMGGARSAILRKQCVEGALYGANRQRDVLVSVGSPVGTPTKTVALYKN